MLQNYEMIFAKVMEQKGYEVWYELFDSVDFDLVQELCEQLENFDLEVFENWVQEMAYEL